MELDTIACMDALEFLRGLDDSSVDMVLTDPPYGHNNGVSDLAGARARDRVLGGRRSGEIVPIVNDDYDTWSVLIPSIIKECSRVLKDDRNIALFTIGGGGKRTTFVQVCQWIEIYLDFTMAIVWDKSARGYGLGWHYRRNYEFIMIAAKGNSRWASGRQAQPNVVYFSPVANQLHPTQKPPELMQWLIENHTNPGDIICDPFIGSGTTALAAKLTGRHYIGCDNSQQYVDIANARLADLPQDKTLTNGTTQLSLFADL